MTTFLTPTGAAKQTTHLRAWAQGRGYYRTVQALNLAQTHMTGLRKDGVTPTWTHPVAVASFLRTIERLVPAGDIVLATALGHDLVEDTAVTIGAIEQALGREVAHAVALLSKDGNGEKASLSLYFAAMAENPVSVLVKGADRLHNFHTMPGVFSRDKQREYIQECRTHIMPMLKVAGRHFPTFEDAMVNVRSVLALQITAFNAGLETGPDGADTAPTLVLGHPMAAR